MKSDWICFQIIMKCLWIVQANQWKSIFRCHSFDQKLNCIFSITAHAVVILFGYMAGWPWSESINHVFGGQKLYFLSLSLPAAGINGEWASLRQKQHKHGLPLHHVQQQSVTYTSTQHTSTTQTHKWQHRCPSNSRTGNNSCFCIRSAQF